ncbi:MAG: DUF421 domain-containing protein [Alphaproteobacteria bacterium]|nr:DUF421 domain-containing protein [Alphaproteobacteria bacterium]
MEWILADARSLLLVGLSVLGMFAVLVLLTRLSGVRSFSKMSAFDFAITVAVGSVLASVVVTEQPSLMRGGAALVALFVVQIGVATLRVRFRPVCRLVDNHPRLIMVGGEMLGDQMRKAKITEADLRAKLREANVLDIGQIEAVVAETTGDVSVLHRSPDGPHLDEKLLDGVLGREVFVSYRRRRSA